MVEIGSGDTLIKFAPPAAVAGGGGAGGRAGYSVQLNGHSVTWLGGDTAPNVYGPVV